MGNLSQLHPSGIRLKLVGLILLVSSALVLLGGITYTALSNVQRLATSLVGEHMAQLVDRASSMRRLSAIFSGIDLVGRTFPGRDDILSLEGEPLLAALASLNNSSSSNESFKEALGRLTHQMSIFLAACRTMNTLIHARMEIEQKTHQDMDELEQRISRALIAQIQQGTGSSHLEQMFALVTAYRESLLHIDKMSLSLPAARSGGEPEQWRQPILAAIDDLLLRLKTISASSHEMTTHAKQISADILVYRDSISRLTAAMTDVDASFQELNAIRQVFLGILQDEDRQTEAESRAVGGEIGQIVHTAQITMLSLVAVLLVLVTTLTIRIVRGDIERPLRLIVQRIAENKSGQIPSPADFSEIVEWRTIEIALQDMWSGLALAHSQLRDSELRLRILVRTAPDLIWLKDPEGVFLSCNTAFERLFGVGEADIVGKTDYDFVEAELADFFRQKDLEAIAAGRPSINEEWLTFAADGRRALMETIKTPMHDADGRLIGVLGIARDITLLRESQATLSSIIENSRDWIWSVDPCNFGLLIFSSTLKEYFSGKLSIDIHSGMTPEDLLPPQNAGIWRGFYKRALDEGFFQTEYQTLAGSITLLISFDCVSRDDKVVCIVVFGKDITERKRAELELIKLRRCVEESSATIVITDKDGSIEYVNPAFTESTQYRQEEVLGENPRILKSEMHDAAFYTDMWQTLLDGKTWRGEICNRKKNGQLYWEYATISPVMGQDGKACNYVAVKDDISDKKELERIKDDVERMMRHDLKTPLNAIIGLPQVLALGDNLTEEQQEMVQTIYDSGERMLHMVNSSLDLFKMETGQYEYVPMPVNALVVIEQLVEHSGSRMSFENKSLHITVDGIPPLPGQAFVIDSEERLLYTLLSNLIWNAIEASPQGEPIDVEFTNTVPKRIAIRNTGTVPKEVRHDFFDKYKTHGKKSGTGLGTYSAKLHADTMGYGLHMTTSDENNVTCVTISLPAVRG